MSRNGRSRTTTIVAFLAGILIATAGTATAAKLITGKQVKNGSLTGLDVKDGSLAGADLAPRTITGGQIAPGAITADKVASGVLPAAAPAGLSGLEVVSASQGGAVQRGTQTATAVCPAGKKAIGGGGSVSGSSLASFTGSAPGTGLTTWRATGYIDVPSGFPYWTVYAYAVCANG